MKIIKSEGCINYYTNVDGRDLYDLTEEEKEVLFDRLLKIHSIHGIEATINLLLDNIEYDFEEGSDCDQCGDSINRRIYNLDDNEGTSA